MPQFDGDVKLSVDLTPGDIKSTLQELQGAIRRIFSDNAGKDLGDKFRAAQVQISKTYDSATKLYDELTRLENTQIPTGEYKEISNFLAQTEKSYGAVSNKLDEMTQKGDTFGAKYSQLQEKAEELKNAIASAKGELQDLVDTGKAFTLGSDTDAYQQKLNQLNHINDTLTIQYTKLEQIAKAAGGAVEPTQRTAQTEEELKARLGEVKGRLGQVNKELAKSALKKFGTWAGRAAKNIGKLAGGAILGGIKKLGAGIKSMAKNMLSFHKSSGRGALSLKKLFGAMLGIRGLFGLIRKLKSAITESFDGIAAATPEFKATLDSFKSSLNQLKGSFGAAFAPLAQYVMPILTNFMNIISEAMTKVGMFIATLTGAKTFTRAVAVQGDYNKELKDTSKAAKEAQKQLAGFDDINILSAPKDSGNGANSDDNSALGFEQVPIDFEVSSLAEKIKSLFQSKDWEGLGEFAGQKINDLFSTIKSFVSWDNVGEQITETVNAITTTINSLVDTVDWELIGSTFAEGVNTVLNTLNLFLTGIDWVNLGTAFATLILGFVDNVDWDAFADLIANGISSVFDLAGGFMKKLKTGNLATKLANALNKIIAAVKEKHIGAKIGEILTAAVSMAFEFLANIDYGNLLIAIYEFVMDLLENVDLGEIMKNVSAFISNVFTGISKALGKISLLDIVIAIQNASNRLLTEMDWGQILRSILRFIVVLFERLAIEIVPIIVKSLLAPIELTLGFIESVINGFGGNVNLTGWIDDIDAGLKEFSAEASSVVDATNVAFDEWDANIAESRANTDANMSGMSSSVSTAFGEIDSAVSETTRNVISSYDAFLEELKRQAEDELYENVNIYDTAAGRIYEVVDASGKQRMLTEAQYNEEIRKASEVTWNDIAEVVDVGGQKMFRIVDKHGNETVTTYDELMKSANYTTALRLKELKNKYGNINLVPEGRAAIEGFAKGLDEKWAFLDGKTKAQAAQIKRNYADAMQIHSPSRWFRDKIGKMIPLGVAEGIDAEEDAALRAVDHVASAMYNTALNDVKMPAVALGGVVPYSVQMETTSIQSTLDNLTAAINAEDRVTREDLYSIITDVVRENMRIEFYLGDEQVARHAQAGAQRLSRRFNPVGA